MIKVLCSVIVMAVLLAGCSGTNYIARCEIIDELVSLNDKPVMGFGGLMGGTSGDVLILAGGANFPDSPPWEVNGQTKGSKLWYDDIYVYNKDGSWLTGNKLPFANGYGGSVSTEFGLVLAGGCDAAKCYDDVLLLNWDAAANKVAISQLPSLPIGIARMGSAYSGGKIYLFGGFSSIDMVQLNQSFLSFDLAKFIAGDKSIKWEQLPMPSAGAKFACMGIAAKDANNTDAIYIIGGVKKVLDADGIYQRLFIKETWSYNISNSSWTQLSDAPRTLASAGAVAWDNSLILLGGSSGKHIHKRIDLRPEFPKEILQYDIASDKWQTIGQLKTGVVTTTAIPFDAGIILPSGERKPGVRTPVIQKIQVSK